MKRADDPLVAICMATHNPPQSLFQRQVESICSQTHERFVCLVSDDCSEHEALDRIERACEADPRFVLAAHSEKVGFYRNFERCLSHVPREAAFVALADHDDDWSHDKLEVLLGALLDSGALLAYSDMRVVDEHGGVVAPSYWTGRKNNHERFGSLLLANTVTGAASLFRRELLDDVLPFPPPVGHAFHDHWIACVALCLGEITYVDRPLYDYVQHGGNVIGHNAPPRSHRSGLLALLLRFFRNPSRRLRTTVAHARDLYVSEAVRLEVFSRELELRLAGRMEPGRAKTVHRLARLSHSPAALMWLLARSARDVRGDSETFGIENEIVKGILWRYAQEPRAVAQRLRNRLAGSR